MLFNSIEFLLFLPIVFVLYWFVLNKNNKHQNLLILVSSYFFYGWWDYRFLSLIAISTIFDYFIGLRIESTTQQRKRQLLLWSSIIFNLSILGFFKYFNFFIDSFSDLLESVGYTIQSKWTLNVILPVGISFYTFQTMSYSLDIYRKRLKPTTDFISFATFVAFFPQLVAGPIERASNLLPQILKGRTFDPKQATQGLKLILWGMFKKVVIADTLAYYVDSIFTNHTEFSSGTLWLGAIYFAFQIYCDFSGYSDIAIGTSKLFGFELMSNFKFPYFSRNIGEFWRRWHVSLSNWFRDYLYIPLGGSKGSQTKTIRNVFVIFIVSGFWHGANWTFVFWGLIHAFLYIPFFLMGTNRKYLSEVVAENSSLPTIKELLQIGITFFFVLIGWVFFRSPSVEFAFDYLRIMFFEFEPVFMWKKGIPFVVSLLVLDWIFRKNERKPISLKYKTINYIIALALFTMIVIYWGSNDVSFIYFQF